MNVSSCVGTRRQNLPSSVRSLGVSGTNHILRVHGHTILQERQAADIFDEVEQRSLERDSFQDSQYKRARDVASPAHFGALIAAKPRILGIGAPGRNH